MALEETVIDDGEFNMDELITFNRPHLDHDYQVVKTVEPEKPLPGGYLDLPIDEDWPPNLKRRIKRPDYPPIVKAENYENFRAGPRSHPRPESESTNFAKGLITNALLSTSRKLGELLDSFPPIPVNNEDLVIEEVPDHEVRNGSEVKTFTVSGGGFSNF